MENPIYIDPKKLENMNQKTKFYTKELALADIVILKYNMEDNPWENENEVILKHHKRLIAIDKHKEINEFGYDILSKNMYYIIKNPKATKELMYEMWGFITETSDLNNFSCITNVRELDKLNINLPNKLNRDVIERLAHAIKRRYNIKKAQKYALNKRYLKK